MSATLQFIGDWGHALAAVLFAAIGFVLLRRKGAGTEYRLLAGAVLATACWAVYVSLGGVSTPLAGLGESIRNAAWLLALFMLLRRGPAGRTGLTKAVSALYAAVAGLLLLQTFMDLAGHVPAADGNARALVMTSLMLRMMTAIGSLLLVHHLYTAWPSRERRSVAMLLGALAAMWTYDLNLYAIGYAAPGKEGVLYALRGLLLALLAPVFALSVRKDMAERLQLSRAVAMRSLSAAAILIYLLVLSALALLVGLIAGPYARAVEVIAAITAAVTALALLPSARFRALAKVLFAKHFFRHRYDYRTEWMRFGETIGHRGEGASPLGRRVAQAMADITDSMGAILLLRDEAGGLAVDTHWQWQGGVDACDPIAAASVLRIEQTGWIVDLTGADPGEGIVLPDWMRQDRRSWALVPLIHYSHLIGAVLLARPPVDRRLDWEDFDMLRAAGRQAATHISEAQGQQALSDAQRFDEFNRRFAFIIHDVKNVVSQLSLLARNAERHADNPDFRADMILTLKESVGRMNDLLARLSQHNKGRPEDPRPTPVRTLMEDIARTRMRQHAVIVSGDAPPALADPVRLEQILLHLVQNAIDASDADSPVELRLSEDTDAVLIDIVDQGCGMSADYIRRELFKPFSSSKPGGFGLGAFEARSLAEAMGGRIDVDSRVGQGTRFTLSLPRASQEMEDKAA